MLATIHMMLIIAVLYCWFNYLWNWPTVSRNFCC